VPAWGLAYAWSAASATARASYPRPLGSTRPTWIALGWHHRAVSCTLGPLAAGAPFIRLFLAWLGFQGGVSGPLSARRSAIPRN
jgi:hypothetical protein